MGYLEGLGYAVRKCTGGSAVQCTACARVVGCAGSVGQGWSVPGPLLGPVSTWVVRPGMWPGCSSLLLDAAQLYEQRGLFPAGRPGGIHGGWSAPPAGRRDRPGRAKPLPHGHVPTYAPPQRRCCVPPCCCLRCVLASVLLRRPRTGKAHGLLDSQVRDQALVSQSQLALWIQGWCTRAARRTDACMHAVGASSSCARLRARLRHDAWVQAACCLCGRRRCWQRALRGAAAQIARLQCGARYTPIRGMQAWLEDSQPVLGL